MRLTAGTRDVEREVAVLDSLIVTEERLPLERLVAQLQAAESPQEFYGLHDALLKRFYARQKVTDELRSEISVVRERLAAETAKRPVERDRVIPVQAELARLELAVQSCSAVTHALRCVGDGIAWKALRFERAAISVLGEGRRVGRLADAKGLDAELAMIDYWWQQESFAIHNDLTNCLRTGDLTLPFQPDNSVAIQEVKAGGNRRRTQDLAIERRLRFLQDGRAAQIMGAAEVRLARYPVKLRTHLPVLGETLGLARRAGYAVAQPSPAVLVVACDPSVSRGEPGIDVVEREACAQRGWGPEAHIVRTVTMLRRLRERRHHFPYLAPLTIYPFSPQDVAELVLGPLEYVTVLHAPSLEAEFRTHGIDAEVLAGTAAGGQIFLRAQRGDAAVELPALVGEQLLSELLDPSMLAEAVTHMLGQVERNVTGNALISFEDEASTWTAPRSGRGL